MRECQKPNDAEQSELKRTSTVMIYDACVNLYNQGQTINREILQITLPNLTRGKIDDRLKYLVETHQLHRVDRGVYIPMFKHRPARLISKMTLPDGTVRIEIGDEQVLILTPKEARDLGLLVMGEAMMLNNIEKAHTIGQNLSQQVFYLTLSIKSMSKNQNTKKQM